MNIAQVYSAPASIAMQNTSILKDKNKGTLGNRMDCMTEQTKSNLPVSSGGLLFNNTLTQTIPLRRRGL